MDEFEFRDSQFTFSSNSQLNLSVQIASHFISFAIQEKTGNKLLFLKHIPYEPLKNWAQFAERLEKIILTQANLHGKFSSAEVMWISDKYSLVPNEYADEQYLKKLFQVVHPLNEDEELDLKHLAETEYQVLFSIPQEVAHELKKYWPDLHFSNQLVPLHFAYLKNKSKSEDTSVYTQVYPEFADFIVYQKGSLKLANSFMLHEKKDFIYHLMNIFKHFNLNPVIDSLFLADHYFHGISGQESLKKYFHNAQFLHPKVPDSNLSLFQAQDISRYVNLLNQINCE